MVLHTSIISESKVSITVLCLPCSPCYTSVRIKNCSKSTSNQSSHYENTMVPCSPVIIWNWSIHCPSLSGILNSLHSSTNQELFESTSVIATMNTDDFHYAKEAIMCNHQINTFHCQQRWMEHKEGHWYIPEECIGYTTVRHLSGWSTVEKSSW